MKLLSLTRCIRWIPAAVLLGFTILAISLFPVLPMGPSEAALSSPPSDPDGNHVERQIVAGPAEDSMADLLIEPNTIEPEVLDALPAVPELLGSTGETLRSLRRELVDAHQEHRWAEGEILLRTGTVAAAQSSKRRAVTALARAREERSDAEHDLSVMGIEAFINQSDQTDVGALLIAANEGSGSAASTAIRSHELYRSAGSALGTRLADRQREERDREQNLADSIERLVRESTSLASARETEQIAAGDIDRLEPQVASAERDFERQLLLRTIPGTEDLTVVSVNAYVTAARVAATRWPNCGLSWDQLAGVGRVESFHGQFGSSSVDRRGNASPPILGPQLNGDPWLAIPDSDLGLLDGDLEWDRAVGPMQFIPTSWDLFGADGNGDGRSDPHNLYDAALGAADHLCGAGLDTETGFRNALLRYNRSTTYGSDVIRFADFYRKLLPIDQTGGADENSLSPVG